MTNGYGPYMQPRSGDDTGWIGINDGQQYSPQVVPDGTGGLLRQQPPMPVEQAGESGPMAAGLSPQFQQQPRPQPYAPPHGQVPLPRRRDQAVPPPPRPQLVVRNPAFADARPTGGARHSAAEAMGHVAVRPAGKLPAERGWRRWLYLLSHINLGLSPDEVYERDLHARIRRIVTPPPGTVQGYQCAVVSLKGGVGKTSLTMLLGSVVAMVRGERALAVDANPDAGNLIQRASRQTNNTVAQLVSSAEVLTGYNAVREMTNQNGANLEVLAADDYVDSARSLEAQDWNTVTGVVSPFYPIVIADCGIGLHTAVTRAVLDSAWGLIVVSDASKDGATAAGQTFDWLRSHGYSDLASRAVAVVNHTRPGKGSADVEQIKERLAVEVAEGNTFELPYEQHIEEGGEIDIRLVSSLMRRRITELGAALSECFDKPRRGVAPC